MNTRQIGVWTNLEDAIVSIRDVLSQVERDPHGPVVEYAIRFFYDDATFQWIYVVVENYTM